jgi:KDO2-lipid IV(A) lauroyltransferase
MARKTRHTALGRFLYKLRYRFGEYVSRGFMICLPYLPDRMVTWFFSSITWASFLILRRYRARMAKNIAATMGREIPDAAARNALVWEAWRNFARTIIDTIKVVHLPRERIISNITLVGEEHLQAALRNGKGVIALSAHLGAFSLIGPRLAAGGYPFSVVVKHPADKRFAQLTDDYRARVGVSTIPAKPRRNAVRGIVKALRENRIVLVIADEFKSGEILVDFFGVKVPAPRGPATLALRTGAVTLPMFAVRRLDDSVLLSIEAAIEPILSDDLETSVVATTARFTARLEQAIRQYPAQWNWLGLPRHSSMLSDAERVRREREARRESARRADSAMRKTGTSS